MDTAKEWLADVEAELNTVRSPAAPPDFVDAETAYEAALTEFEEGIGSADRVRRATVRYAALVIARGMWPSPRK